MPGPFQYMGPYVGGGVNGLNNTQTSAPAGQTSGGGGGYPGGINWNDPYSWLSLIAWANSAFNKPKVPNIEAEWMEPNPWMKEQYENALKIINERDQQKLFAGIMPDLMGHYGGGNRYTDENGIIQYEPKSGPAISPETLEKWRGYFSDWATPGAPTQPGGEKPPTGTLPPGGTADYGGGGTADYDDVADEDDAGGEEEGGWSEDYYRTAGSTGHVNMLGPTYQFDSGGYVVNTQTGERVTGPPPTDPNLPGGVTDWDKIYTTAGASGTNTPPPNIVAQGPNIFTPETGNWDRMYLSAGGDPTAVASFVANSMRPEERNAAIGAFETLGQTILDSGEWFGNWVNQNPTKASGALGTIAAILGVAISPAGALGILFFPEIWKRMKNAGAKLGILGEDEEGLYLGKQRGKG